MTRKILKLGRGAPHSCCVACLQEIRPGSGLSCTSGGLRLPHLMRIRGRSHEKRRETTRYEWKRRDGRRARMTLVGPLDTPSVERGPLYSASPAYWLPKKILSHEPSLLNDCLWLLARCSLLLLRDAVPPPRSSDRVGLLAHDAKRLLTSGESVYRVKKKKALLQGIFFSANHKHTCLFRPSPLHRRRPCCPAQLPTQRQTECPTFPKHAYMDGRLTKERGG